MELILAIIAALFIGLIVIYNKLIRDKNRVFQAWSDIAVQLKKRHDLIPKLVAAVDAYAHYERTTLDEVTRLRVEAERSKQPKEKALVEKAYTQRVQVLLAVAEAYPDLKADQQYLDLMLQLSDVENQIQFARRYYNGAVRNLNVRIDSFPDLILARVFRFQTADFFELELLH